MIALALVLALQASSSDIIVAGAGRSSCATWLETPASELVGNVWIQGYWSGLAQAPDAHGVGHTTDNNGVWAEVKQVCARSPSMPLYVATYLAFKGMKERGQ